jgi:hypothetical protein
MIFITPKMIKSPLVMTKRIAAVVTASSTR